MTHFKIYTIALIALGASTTASQSFAAEEQIAAEEQFAVGTPEWKIEAKRRIDQPLKVNIRWNVESDEGEPGLILSLKDDNVVFDIIIEYYE